MNDERDPALEALFSEAQRNLSDEEFTVRVRARIEKRRRWVIGGRLAIVAVLVAFEFLLAAPLQTTVAALTQALATNLVPLQNDWLAIALGPLNSIAGLIGVGLLLMQSLYRRLLG